MRVLYLFIFVLVLTGCTGVKAMKIEKPSYYIKLEMENCPRLITVNGIEVERDFLGQVSYAEYPINHYIKNGSNFFELMVGSEEYMKEVAENGSKCIVQIRVRGLIEGEEVDYKISDIIYTPNYTGNKYDLVKSSMPAGGYKFGKDNETFLTSDNPDYTTGKVNSAVLWQTSADDNFRREFEAVVPFPRWQFFDADRAFIPPKDDDEYDEVEAKILPKVYELRELFRNKELDKILPLFEMRSNEIDQAFYKEPGETQADLRRSIERVFKKDFPLAAFTESKKEMVISHDGKLFGIVDAGNMIGTISFWNEEADMINTYTVYWMIKDGKWIIAR